MPFTGSPPGTVALTVQTAGYRVTHGGQKHYMLRLLELMQQCGTNYFRSISSTL